MASANAVDALTGRLCPTGSLITSPPVYPRSVTYNFDPDRWYERQQAALEDRHRRGELTADELEEMLGDLETRYHEMVERLDGTFHIPG